jgi:hypothetical protein
MTRTHMFIATSALSLAVMVAWQVLRPVVPSDTPYFHWAAEGEAYELVVSHVEGNPDFRNGVDITPVPRTGTLRVVGPPGTAQPGALVEVSNPRTGEAYLATADAGGGFAIEAQARRGDELRVISRKIQLRRVAPPAYSSAVLSSP